MEALILNNRVRNQNRPLPDVEGARCWQARGQRAGRASDVGTRTRAPRRGHPPVTPRCADMFWLYVALRSTCFEPCLLPILVCTNYMTNSWIKSSVIHRNTTHRICDTSRSGSHPSIHTDTVGTRILVMGNRTGVRPAIPIHTPTRDLCSSLYSRRLFNSPRTEKKDFVTLTRLTYPLSLSPRTRPPVRFVQHRMAHHV